MNITAEKEEIIHRITEEQDESVIHAIKEMLDADRNTQSNYGPELEKEHEVVIATTQIANVPKGTTGTVVHVYANGNAYEVEFIINGTSFVETALKSQVEKK